ncbi:MAG: AbrB/MazE/SpoVT family DNA-binding domain-containing protein [Deltaproteobacteria bacterium]
MQQTLIVSSRGQLTLPSSLRKRLGLRNSGAVIMVERNNEVVIKPAAVLEIEMYSDDQIAVWDDDDRLSPEERSNLLARFAKQL